MADPKQFGLAEWGVVAFFILSLITAVGILWRSLRQERRLFLATVEKVTVNHNTLIKELVDDHRAEMKTLVDRQVVTSDNQVVKYQAMVEKMVEVLASFSRKLDKRRGGGGGTT